MSDFFEVLGIDFCIIPHGFFIRGSSSTEEESPKETIELSKYMIS